VAIAGVNLSPDKSVRQGLSLPPSIGLKYKQISGIWS